MNIAIRVDASRMSGTGHLVRCRTLARALQARGAHIQFICREHPGNLISELKEEGFPVSILPKPESGASAEKEDYKNWLGVPPEQDAEETIQALNGPVDWLIVDHYALDEEWEAHCRARARRIFVIDDIANRQHDCDVLLDQNYTQNPEERYNGLVPPSTQCLIGPSYALLSPEYLAYRKHRKPHTGSVDRIFIFFGGSDPDNLTGRTLNALKDADLGPMQIDVVIGASAPNKDAIEATAKQLPSVILYKPRPHLADIISEADLAIGAGGTTTWERMALGLPSLIISIADNQIPACRDLANDNLIRYAGHGETVSAKSIHSLVKELIASPDELKSLSSKARALVDGRGAERVVDTIYNSS